VEPLKTKNNSGTPPLKTHLNGGTPLSKIAGSATVKVYKRLPAASLATSKHEKIRNIIQSLKKKKKKKKRLSRDNLYHLHELAFHLEGYVWN
jgi:hypothetical protein